MGHLGKGVRRNVPSLYNVAFTKDLFLDGRERSLEQQIWSPLLAENEMANESREAVLAKLALNPVTQRGLQKRLMRVSRRGRWDGSLPRINVPCCPATRHLIDGTSVVRDQPGWVRVLRVIRLWRHKASPFFKTRAVPRVIALTIRLRSLRMASSTTRVRVIGARVAHRPPSVQLAPGVFVVPTVDAETETFTDDGRFEVTGREADKWRYRTPSLRNVALTGPYMHDGSIATLEGVVAFYAEGGGGDPTQDPRTRSVQLTESDQERWWLF